MCVYLQCYVIIVCSLLAHVICVTLKRDLAHRVGALGGVAAGIAISGRYGRFTWSEFAGLGITGWETQGLPFVQANVTTRN